MISKSQIQLISSLKQKKYRKIHKLFAAEGVKTVDELLESTFTVHSLYATPSWLHHNIGKARKIRIANIYEINEETLKKISSLENPNQVLALVKIPEKEKAVPCELLLVLDGIRDPGNLGTIIRIADWYALPFILCSEDSVDVYNPKVIQASMGSIFRIKVLYDDLSEFSAKHPQYNIYGATLDGNNLHSLKPDFPAAVFIGNESEGLREKCLTQLKEKISIPRYGKAESLNASVAAGIICDSFVRSAKL